MKRVYKVVSAILCMSLIIVGCTAKGSKVSENTFYTGYVYKEEIIPIFLQKGQELYLKYPDKESELLVDDMASEMYFKSYVPEDKTLVYKNKNNEIISMNIESKEKTKINTKWNELVAIDSGCGDSVFYNTEEGFKYKSQGTMYNLYKDEVAKFQQLDEDTVVFITYSDELYIWKNGNSKLIDKDVPVNGLKGIGITWRNQITYETKSEELKNYDIKRDRNYRLGEISENEYTEIIASEDYVVYNISGQGYLYNKNTEEEEKVLLPESDSEKFDLAYFSDDYIYYIGMDGGIYALNLKTKEAKKIFTEGIITLKMEEGKVLATDVMNKDWFELVNGEKKEIAKNASNVVSVSGKYIIDYIGGNVISIAGEDIVGNTGEWPIIVRNNFMIYRNNGDILVYDLSRGKVFNYGSFEGYDKILFVNY